MLSLKALNIIKQKTTEILSKTVNTWNIIKTLYKQWRYHKNSIIKTGNIINISMKSGNLIKLYYETNEIL